jgi:hypothetical protein
MRTSRTSLRAEAWRIPRETVHKGWLAREPDVGMCSFARDDRPRNGGRIW